jgi:hypothetical protein
MSVVDQLNAASLNQASALIGQSCRASPAAQTKGRRRRGFKDATRDPDALHEFVEASPRPSRSGRRNFGA